MLVLLMYTLLSIFGAQLSNSAGGLKVNQSVDFSCIKMFSLLMFCVFLDSSNFKLKNKQYRQKTLPKSYAIENKIPANPGLA